MTPIELRARREALGLSQSECASVLCVTQATISRWETGARPIPAGITHDLTCIEEAAENLIDMAAAGVEEIGPDFSVLFVHPTDASLWAAHPEMDGIPASVHRVAMALAARECGGVPLMEAPTGAL